MKVKAVIPPGLKHGFYGGKRRYDNQEFSLTDPEDFSEKWMVKLEEDKPKRGPKPKAIVEESGE